MNAQPLPSAPEFELPRRVARKIAQFAGRSWLLPELIRWWQSEERFFVLKGGPGSGKSMISGWLAGQGPEPAEDVSRAQLRTLRDAVAVVHFCQADSFSLGPRAFAETAVNQLLERVPEFSPAFLATRPQFTVNVNITATTVTGGEITGLRNVTLGEASDSVNFNNGFVKPLVELYERGYERPLLIVIDGLDEEVSYDGQTGLAQLLSRLGELPPQIRFFVTSRDEDRVLQHFDVKPLDLITDAPNDIDDVRDFAFDYLAKKTPDASLAASVASHVATAAEGVFLYAVRVLEDFSDELLKPDAQSLQVLPKGLPGIYRAFLQRELGVEDKGKRWHRVYKPLLGCIAVAQGAGIDAKLLADVVGEDSDDALEVCRQYLVGPKGTGPFRVFHKSFADFLLGGAPEDRYFIDAAEMHAKIADVLWRRYSADWSRSDAYTRNSLALHLAEGRCYDKFDAFLSPPWKAARSTDSTLFNFSEDLDQVWRASRLNADREASVLTGFRCALIRGAMNANARTCPVPVLVRAFELELVPVAALFSLQQSMQPHEAINLSLGLLATGNLAKKDWAYAYAMVSVTAAHLEDLPDRTRGLISLARVSQGIPAQKALGEAIDASRLVADLRERAELLRDIILTDCLEDPGALIDELLKLIEGTLAAAARNELVLAVLPRATGDRSARLSALIDLSKKAPLAAANSMATTQSTVDALSFNEWMAQTFDDAYPRFIQMPTWFARLQSGAKELAVSHTLHLARLSFATDRSNTTRTGALIAGLEQLARAGSIAAPRIFDELGHNLPPPLLIDLASSLAPMLDEASVRRAIRISSENLDASERIRLLTAISANSTGDVRERSITAALGAYDRAGDRDRLACAHRLLELVSADRQTQIVDDASRLVVADPTLAATVITTLVAHFDSTQASTIVRAMQIGADSSYQRRFCVAVLASRLEAEERTRIAEFLLAGFQQAKHNAEIATWIVDVLNEEQLQRCFDSELLRVAGGEYPGRLISVTRRVAPDDRKRAVECIWPHIDRYAEKHGPIFYLRLAPILDAAERADVIAAVTHLLRTRRVPYDSTLLKLLAKLMEPQSFAELLEDCVNQFPAMDPALRGELMTGFARHMNMNEMARVNGMVSEIPGDTARYEARIEIVARLAELWGTQDLESFYRTLAEFLLTLRDADSAVALLTMRRVLESDLKLRGDTVDRVSAVFDEIGNNWYFDAITLTTPSTHAR